MRSKRVQIRGMRHADIRPRFCSRITLPPAAAALIVGHASFNTLLLRIGSTYFRFETLYRFGECQFVRAGVLVTAYKERVDRLCGEC